MQSHSQTRLGRGLSALLGDAAREAPRGEPAQALRVVPIGKVVPNRFQPRKEFRQDDLGALEASMRANGLLQPITVRADAKTGGFELIAGERRLRAAQRLGWTEIPAVVRETDDRALLSLAIVENLQRTDLNPIEEAEGYQRLLEEFSLTQQEVADAVGKERSTVANILRLLALPASVRRLVWEGALSVGHARALLSFSDPGRMAEMAKLVVTKGLSVRDVERAARAHAPSKRAREPKASQNGSSADVRRIEGALRARLQTDVKITTTAGGAGELRLSFYSADDLERLLDLIVGPGRDAL